MCSWWRLNSRCARLSVLCFTIWNTRLVLCRRQTVCECMRFTVWVKIMHAQMHPSTFRIFYISIILVIPLGLGLVVSWAHALCVRNGNELSCWSVSLLHFLKELFTQYWQYCYYLLTLVLLWTCMGFFVCYISGLLNTSSRFV